MARFPERLGTSGIDYIESTTGTVNFGLAGNDSLYAEYGSDSNILIGGSGNDFYFSQADTTITIADTGSSSRDTLVTDSLGPSYAGYTAVIDNRHFLAFNPNTGETAYILDFLSSANYIERIETPDGVFSTNELFNYAKAQPSFLGYVSWADLQKQGLNQALPVSEINEAIDFYTFKARALEVDLPDGDAGSIYRFFNTKTGTHFYTSSLVERDQVATNLPSYVYEGNAFDSDANASNGAPVFRFYNNQTGTHFYTISTAERDQVQKTLPQYTYEGEAYFAYTSGGGGREELHRFFNKETGTHFYTASDVEQQQVIKTLPQYAYEGVAYYVDIA